MTNPNIKDKEEQIYNKIIELKNGTIEERTLAFKCLGILGNESTTEPFENRLILVDELINDNSSKRKIN